MMRRQRTARASEDLRRTASNVLSTIASRLTTRGWPEPPPPPDGGIKAWTQVACGWIAIFVTWGYLNSFGSFQTYYEQTMPGTRPSTISWIGSLQIWLTMVMGLFTGRLLDAGFFVPTFFVGACLQVLGMFLMSVSKTYWQLMLTQGVLTGLGGGIFFTPSLALVTTYFDKKRGLAMGLVTTGNSVGGIVYPLVVRQLIPKLGFAWTSRVLGFINLTALGLCVAFLRPRLPPRKSGPIIDWAAFREPVFDAFVAGWWLIMWANYYTFYYIASFAVAELGMSYSAASVLVMILNGAALPFRIIVPLFSDHLGPINVLLPVTLTWVIVAFCWLAVRNIGGYYAFTAVYGATSGAFQCLLPTTIASITDRLDKVGTRMGMAFCLISVASMAGPPVGGALQTAGPRQFLGPQLWAACSVLVGFVLILVARWARAGLSLRTKC
ncbi:major facilitator superfamily domain-containing protein [Diaporthe sp. PMI_573]|nr:major facilitator superfamily domain-containing protein [Diaporthaceae sp. PMI_573]